MIKKARVVKMLDYEVKEVFMEDSRKDERGAGERGRRTRVWSLRPP